MTNPQSGIRIGLSVDSEPVGPPVTPADAPPTAPLRIGVDEREVTAAPRIEGDSGIAPRIRRRVHVSKDALLGPVQQPVDHLPATEIVFNIHADTDSSQPNKAARLPLPADYGARGQSVLWIDLKIRPDQFSKDDEQVLINTVARILGIKAASIHVFSVEAGSVRCALWLPVVLDLDMVSEFQAKLARRPDTRRFRPGKCSVSRHSTDHHTILFFSASPRDQPRIGTEDEFRAIKEGLDRALYGSAFCVQQIPAARWTDLRESLLQYRPSIVHFSAHGTQSGELVLQTLSRNSYVVAANDLAELLGLLYLLNNRGRVNYAPCQGR